MFSDAEDFRGRSENICKHLRSSAILCGCQRISEDALKTSVILCRTFQRLSQCFRPLRVAAEDFRGFQSISEDFRGFQRISEHFRAFHVERSKRRAHSTEWQWGRAMVLAGRVRSSEPRAFVLRRACTSTPDGGGRMSPGGRGRVLPAGSGVRLRGPEGVHVRRRRWPMSPGGRARPAGSGVGPATYSGGRARPTEQEPRKPMFLGGRVRPPGSRIFVRRRACTPDGPRRRTT